MNSIEISKKKETYLSGTLTPLESLINLALSRYIPLHEYISEHNSCSDRIKAYNFKRDLPLKIEAIRGTLEKNPFGIKTEVIYETHEQVKEHRRQIWMASIKVANYANCPLSLDFNLPERGINEAIRKNLEWCYLGIDGYCNDQFWGESHKAIVLPTKFYNLLAPPRQKLNPKKSQSLTKIQKDLRIPNNKHWEFFNIGLEGVHTIIYPNPGSISDLPFKVFIDTYYKKQARVMEMAIPINLDNFRTKPLFRLLLNE